MCDALPRPRPDRRGRDLLRAAALLPDGARNGLSLQRLKDKLGNRSNASREVEFRGAAGADGRRARAAACRRSSRWSTTRGWTASSARPPAMRAAVAKATWHAAPPQRVRHAADRAAADGQRARRPRARVRGGDGRRAAARARLRRGATTARRASRWPPRSPSTGSASARPRTPTRRSSAWAATATSRSRRCRGCYREAPLNSIWEGSGNVMALDVLRALAREPEALDAFFAEVRAPRGADARLDAFAAATRARARPTSRRSSRARGGWSSAWRWPAGLAAGAPRAGRGGRRVLRRAPGRRRRAAATARCRAASTRAAIVARHTPPV